MPLKNPHQHRKALYKHQHSNILGLAMEVLLLPETIILTGSHQDSNFRSFTFREITFA